MKICLFTDTLGDLNGVSRFIQDMGEQAALSDITLHILTSTLKPLPNQIYIHNLPFRFKVPMPFYQELDLVWPNTNAIEKALDALRPDWVHISTPGPFGWQAKRVAEKLGYPLIGTYHTDFPAYLLDLTGSQRVKKWTDAVMRRFYQRFEHVFSRSHAYLAVMDKDIGIAAQRSSVIEPGTHLQRFHPKHQTLRVWDGLGLSDVRAKVLYVGRINVEKNIPFLIEVWKAFQVQHPEIKADLVLVGEGRYRKWANKLRQHHVYFLGPIQGDLLSQIYASSDLFVFPSVTDTLGQVVMEAQASGIGCLVSDVGGPKSLVVHEKTGLVVKANSIPDWVLALHQGLTQPELIAAFKSLSRHHMEQYNIVDSFVHFAQTHQYLHSQRLSSGNFIPHHDSNRTT